MTNAKRVFEEDSRICIAVTGTKGQLSRSLVERAAHFNAKVVPLGQPQLNLTDPKSVELCISSASPDVIVNAAAYTAVDLAESEKPLAHEVNVNGARAVAAVAAKLQCPIIHLSTDYVFDGMKSEAYVESDAINPLGTYGKTKADAEIEVTQQTANHVILRTQWIYSPFGNNFVRTMLKLAKDREAVSVVSDQIGCPTSAFAIADGIFEIAKTLVGHPSNQVYRGIFHLAASGETSWAGLAREVFSISKKLGGPSLIVHEILSDDYPQAAQRPKNAILDCSLIERIHGIRLPVWQVSLVPVVERLLDVKLTSAA